MIYEYKKYKDILDFVKDQPLRNKNNQFTIVNKCKGCALENGAPVLNNHCFGCLFCAIQNPELKVQLENLYGDFIKNTAENAFRGVPIKTNIIQKGIRHPYTSLEKFTSVDETTNIQPWATGLLHNICSKQNRISMEVPIFNYDYDRNGRLDICSITDKHLLVMESKTTLEDALSDERFIEQHTKYTDVINEITSDYTYLTLIGGKETDFYPVDSPYCTGNIGSQATRFHKMLVENKIQAISANALWCLCCKYLIDGTDYAWDTFLVDVFRDPKCIGLVSAGKICIVNGKPTIISIS
jgi:hypothetical protein